MTLSIDFQNLSHSSPIKLVLASSSRFRKMICDKVGLRITQFSPDIEEIRAPSETPAEYVQRLSFEKAKAVASQLSIDRDRDIWVVGCDIIGVLNHIVYEKPRDLEEARDFLRTYSGQTISCYIGLTLYSVQSQKSLTRLIVPSATFHDLSDAIIDRYLALEPDACRCSGALRIEGPGMLLIRSIETSDLYAIEGMPIQTLSQMTLEWGVPLATFYEMPALI